MALKTTGIITELAPEDRVESTVYIPPARPGTVTFVAPRNREMDLKRVKPEQYRTLAGTPITADPGLAYRFSDGVLNVVEGQDVRPDGPIVRREDDSIVYDEHRQPVRMEQDAVAWLRQHPWFNNVGMEPEPYFIEMGAEPGRIPPADPELAVVVEASITLDQGALEDLIAEEEAGFGRSLVLNAARKALERVLDAKAAMAAEQGKD